jgi:hypothetical protein
MAHRWWARDRTARTKGLAGSLGSGRWIFGSISIGIPPTSFEFESTAGQNFSGLFPATGTLDLSGPHGDDFFGHCSPVAFKFVNRHVGAPLFLADYPFADGYFRSGWNDIHFQKNVKSPIAIAVPADDLPLPGTPALTRGPAPELVGRAGLRGVTQNKGLTVWC